MSEKRQAPHLLNENPILVYPTLAVALGINKAVVFQQLHFLLNGQKTSNNTHNFVDGKWWVYNSYPEWKRDYFPWLSISSLKGIFNQLEDQKLVIARQSVKNKSDRRKWYTIDYRVWDKFCLTIGQKVTNQPLDKKYPMVGQKLSNGYSETSSETSSDKKEESKRTPSKKIDGWSKENDLIQVWARIRNLDAVAIGAPLATPTRQKCARRMLKWSRPITADEIADAIKVSNSPNYEFAWLESDVPKRRGLHANVPQVVPDRPLELLTKPVESTDDIISPEQVEEMKRLNAMMMANTNANTKPTDPYGGWKPNKEAV